MNGAQLQNTTDIQAQILISSGGGEPSNPSIGKNEPKFLALRPVHPEYPFQVSWTSKAYKEYRNFRFIGPMVNLIDFLKPTHVSPSGFCYTTD